MIVLPLVCAAATAQAPDISADRIREDVRALASDAFEGRCRLLCWRRSTERRCS